MSYSLFHYPDVQDEIHNYHFKFLFLQIHVSSKIVYVTINVVTLFLLLMFYAKWFHRTVLGGVLRGNRRHIWLEFFGEGRKNSTHMPTLESKGKLIRKGVTFHRQSMVFSQRQREGQ